MPTIPELEALTVHLFDDVARDGLPVRPELWDAAAVAVEQAAETALDVGPIREQIPEACHRAFLTIQWASDMETVQRVTSAALRIWHACD